MIDALAALIILGAANAGVTLIVNESTLFEPLREWADRLNPYLGELLRCPVCLGTWVGALEATGAVAYAEISILAWPVITFAAMMTGLIFRRAWY
jgi:hypothetical protein